MIEHTNPYLHDYISVALQWLSCILLGERAKYSQQCLRWRSVLVLLVLLVLPGTVAAHAACRSETSSATEMPTGSTTAATHSAAVGSARTSSGCKKKCVKIYYKLRSVRRLGPVQPIVASIPRHSALPGATGSPWRAHQRLSLAKSRRRMEPLENICRRN